MTDEEAYEFYKDPEHLQVLGRGYRRKADRLTEVKSVRFSARMLAAAEAAAGADDRDVGSWIRMLVSFELIRLARMERERIAREHRPYEVVEGSGRAVAPRNLTSALGTFNGYGKTFACQHMSIGNITGASCGICGPLAAAS